MSSNSREVIEKLEHPCSSFPTIVITDVLEERLQKIAEARGIPVDWVREAHAQSVWQEREFSTVMSEIEIKNQIEQSHTRNLQKKAQQSSSRSDTDE